MRKGCEEWHWTDETVRPDGRRQEEGNSEVGNRLDVGDRFCPGEKEEQGPGSESKSGRGDIPDEYG